MIGNQINNIVDQHIEKFLLLISTEYSLNKDELINKWKSFNNSNINIDDKKKVNKKSGYQNFFTIKRMELKNKNPSLSFGELSSIISQEWNKLNIDEKKNYVNKLPTTITNTQFTFDELNQKKMNDLKDLCEKIGIKKSGNKSELIKNLLGLSSTNDEIKKEDKKLIKKTNENVDNTFEIYVSTNDQKRSDIENSNEIIELEEEEFDFEDEYDSESDDEKTIDDEDEDQNLFDD